MQMRTERAATAVACGRTDAASNCRRPTGGRGAERRWRRPRKARKPRRGGASEADLAAAAAAVEFIRRKAA